MDNGRESLNKGYMSVHNVRTLLELVMCYMERNEADVENLYFAVETALGEARKAEEVLGGSVK